MSENISAPRGKITRLPLAVREQVCERLLQGESARKILPWLNGQPGVKQFLAGEYNGDPINDQNLSAFRHGYYAAWLGRRERVEKTHQLAQVAARYARANGSSIAEGAQAIAAGQILEILEAVDEAATDAGAKIDTDALVKIAGALTNLRTSEQADAKLALEKKKVSQKGEEITLAREKYQRDTCELFLKWHDQKQAVEVAGSDASNADKIEKLGQLMFGDTWQPAKA